MPPPPGDGTGPGPSAALLPCRSKAQELRTGVSSNSLRFLTPGRAKGLIAFGSQWAGPIARRGLCCRQFEAAFSYKPARPERGIFTGHNE
ncbi:hypothetical protein HRM2_13810 [Desulforapulum autotrophicum HRM2]|uniref:Uncharacterized protein n=1 Tax=Desulforapulum autotrophicum (strain ATCC 43914 / DSM 3382 / VKM B-1955 / HRM2) TaxID=177437 RepID=C0Q900_DESAH|nr:hypothetical protein [Desulforapulum autotrophicum]ACN14490.1 hypothetical protein HRM2_13810 [Desulforapulum autotrophicum HRM2]